MDLTLDLFIVALEDSTFRLKKSKTDKTASKLLTHDGHRVVVTHSPFRVDFYSKDILVTSINSAGLLMVEPFKKKVLLTDREKGYWEETFKEHKDSKPHGSSSVGVDIALIGMRFAYGLPEHAESYALRDTKLVEITKISNPEMFNHDEHYILMTTS
ncbi:hypothetical protein TELCIR_04526 [Teladorsagia circumcincta]|uniref:Glycoside hydrolase family 31 N-terminal domain-containing protein n=1 Tax=Teladorsagia circumcincta TaxID=45464 RepID=A0A2G9UTM9_TELCI|nr:hypothetical protein TELCIR_04526 [Teladorsagia circumcincta]